MLPLFPDSSIGLYPDETFRGEDCAPLCTQVAQRDERFVRYFLKAAEAVIASTSIILAPSLFPWARYYFTNHP